MGDRLSQIVPRRRFFSWISLLLATCLIVISCSQSPNGKLSPTTGATSSDANSGSLEVTIATEDDYPPFDFLENGQHVGYNQDLLTAIAKAKSLKIKQEVLPFQGILAGIASNKYTASNSAIGITAKRAEVVDFTMPVTELTNFFLKRKGDASIKDVKDFAGKTIAVQQGGTTSAIWTSHVKPEMEKMGLKASNVKEYGAFGEAYQDLLNQRVDVVFNNVVALKRLVGEKPDLYEIGGQVGPKVYAAWAVKKGNKALLNVLNDGLATAKANGQLKALQEKWLKVAFDLPDQPIIPPA